MEEDGSFSTTGQHARYDSIHSHPAFTLNVLRPCQHSESVNIRLATHSLTGHLSNFFVARGGEQNFGTEMALLIAL